MLRASFILLALLSIVACTAKPIEPKVSEKPPQPVLQKATLQRYGPLPRSANLKPHRKEPILRFLHYSQSTHLQTQLL